MKTNLAIEEKKYFDSKIVACQKECTGSWSNVEILKEGDGGMSIHLLDQKREQPEKRT